MSDKGGLKKKRGEVNESETKKYILRKESIDR